MVVRHEALVAPEPMGAAPRETRRNGACREPFIKPPRSRSARQANREIMVARLRERAKPFGDPLRKRFSALESAPLRRCRAGHCATAIVCIALFRIREIAAA